MTKQKLSTSGALRFTELQLGGPCTENESVPIALTSPTLLVNGNGDRVGLLMMNLGSNNAFVTIGPTPSSTSGILLAANGGFITLNVRDDFTLCTRNWYGIANSSGVQIYVLEIVRFAQSEVEDEV